MCGIAGWVSTDRLPEDADAQLAAMCDAIRHRGPDDSGYFVASRVALGMRRLRVIDIEGSRQPIANECGSVRVVFNGEIYNYKELRRQLIHRGHHFRSSGDTETLVHLYEDQGEQLVHSLRGMFAFALWDAARQRLLLARDRLGIKPLYYWRAPNGVAFASELGSLRALEHFPRRLHRAAVAQYLTFGYVPDPLGIFEKVSKLPPGHILLWDAEHGVEVRRFWSPASVEQARIDEREAIEELRRLLDDAVDCHLVSDVPLGAFLSSGVDSAAVVAHMGRRMDRPVKTFTIGFAETDYNEAPGAARSAQALGADHTELLVTPDVDQLVDDVIAAFDEPFGDSSALPTYAVSELARQHVTVCLSGDGGDELFGGYTRYKELLGRLQLHPPLLRKLLGRLARSLPHETIGRSRLIDLSRTRWGRYAATVASSPNLEDGGIALSVVAGEIGPLDELLEPWTRDSAHREFVTRMMLVDLASYLPGDILTKVDRMSMAVSLEARVPLLDHHLVEFALSLPARLTMRDGRGKWPLREALRGLVPAELFERPKRGFALPIGTWLRRELNHRLTRLQRSDAPIYEFVDTAAVARLCGEHARGRRDHSHMLWRLLALDIWLRSLGEQPRRQRYRRNEEVEAHVGS